MMNRCIFGRWFLVTFHDWINTFPVLNKIVQFYDIDINYSFRVRKLGENAQIHRDDFAASLPKPTKKKRKLFPKYTGQHSDSDFE